MGNAGFSHYNVGYSLQPVRILVSFVRRIYYLLFAEFRWIGTLIIILVRKQLWDLRSSAWSVIGAVFLANLLLVTLFGGAELERYLLPVLPLFYIAVAFGLAILPRRQQIAAAACLIVGLIVNNYWNPPYPFPFENNFAMVDFVELQKAAADYLQDREPGARVATAWPYTAGLSNPDFGYVQKPWQVIETNDFHFDSIRNIPASKYDILIVYTRTWTPSYGMTRLAPVRDFLAKYYEYEPEISEAQCLSLGLQPMISIERRGQAITLYERKAPRSVPTLN
jgi:hypothetical protein